MGCPAPPEMLQRSDALSLIDITIKTYIWFWYYPERRLEYQANFIIIMSSYDFATSVLLLQALVQNWRQNQPYMRAASWHQFAWRHHNVKSVTHRPVTSQQCQLPLTSVTRGHVAGGLRHWCLVPRFDCATNTNTSVKTSRLKKTMSRSD